MDVRLLKINAMKRFYKFMNTNMVALNLWSEYNPVGKIYAGLEKRQEIFKYSDNFLEKLLL